MSRRLNTNVRNRQTQNVAGRAPQVKLTFGGKSGQKNGSKEITTLGRSMKKRKAAYLSDTDSTTSGGESLAESDHDGDDESDEADDESEDPEVNAPSHYSGLLSGAGLPSLETVDNGEWTGFPEPEANAVNLDFDMEDFENKLFDSDDDQVYERVNEVSDSDNDDEEAIQRAETELLTAEFDGDLTSHFANQIDGMSAYGFGDGSDEEGSVVFPFSSSDEDNEARPRHVHFEEQHPVGIENAFAALADSPTMTRALLPSALPDTNDRSLDDLRDAKEAENDDYDTDATEELEAPAKAWQKLTPARQNSQNSATDMSPPVFVPRRIIPSTKGPVRGTFEDNGDKVTAILDPTGKKLLLSDPHLLGGVFARRFGPSAPPSPSVSFSDAVFGESDVSLASNSPRPQSAQLANVDPMFAGLTSGDPASTNGEVTGLPEAFIPANPNFMNDFVSADLFDGDSFDPEDCLRIEDMIAFEGDEDDTDNADSPMLPSFFPESLSAPNTPLAHLNHMNVSAFKRKGEHNFFPSSPQSMIRNKFATPLKRKRRNTRNDSPYNHSHYQGVTPVQRMAAQEHDLSSSPAPASARMHKRRKTIL